MPRGFPPNRGQFQKGDPKLKVKSETHRHAIGEGQRRAWKTGRKRMPVGSRYIDCYGYVRVKVTPGVGRWRLEHVLVMERILGRLLHVGEIVHHIDGDRKNNSDENLYLCRDRKHHQQVESQLKETFRSMLKSGQVTFSQFLGVYSCH